jgi:hypothetical protein
VLSLFMRCCALGAACHARHQLLTFTCARFQAHLDLDIKAKIQLLAGIVEHAEDVPPMLRKQPCILALSEVTIQV